MISDQQEVGGRPLSAVTPEKRVEVARRSGMDAMILPRVTGVSTDSAMKCIIEVR